MKFSLLINMKMPTTVGIFFFISREIFMLRYAKRQTILQYNMLCIVVAIATITTGISNLFLMFLKMSDVELYLEKFSSILNRAEFCH